jgi:hypothetical protein
LAVVEEINYLIQCKINEKRSEGLTGVKDTIKKEL